MSKHLIVTLTGPDRVGFVEGVTKLILENGGNVEKSRMARLGGEFAVLMLVSAEDAAIAAMSESVMKLRDEGYQVATRETSLGGESRYAGWIPYTIEVNGADHEGIIHTITQYLADQGINIETLNTGMVPAPMSGMPLFTMTAVVVAPAVLSLSDLRSSLGTLGDQLSVDTEVTPYKG